MAQGFDGFPGRHVKPCAEDELHQAKNALNLLFAKVLENVDYQLPNGDPRTLTIVEKKKETPNKYPRKAGVPNKRPL